MAESGVPRDYDVMLRECCNDVCNELGGGLTEAIYRNALALALRLDGYQVSMEVVIPVEFQGEVVGSLRADLIVDKIRVIELKVAAKITDAHVQQLEAYLMRMPADATGHVVNFGNADFEVRAPGLLEEEPKKRKRAR